LAKGFIIKAVFIPFYIHLIVKLANHNLTHFTEHSLPKAALGLLTLPIQLDRGDYLTLHSAGYVTADEVLASSTEILANYLNSEQIERLSTFTSVTE
jgi:hypothetical protein